MRKGLEKMRPPDVNELLLTNNGDELLEGTITNFFVVRKVTTNSLFTSLASSWFRIVVLLYFLSDLFIQLEILCMSCILYVDIY